MSSKNVKTLHITWIQWATLIAAVATLVLIVAPRFRHSVSVQERVERVERPAQKDAEKSNRPRQGGGRHTQQPEMVAP
jgi:hypothetical protein